MTRSPGFIDAFDGDQLVSVNMNAINLDAEVNFAAALANQICHMFPKLAGTEFGIEKLFDQRSLGLLLSDVARPCGGRMSSSRKCMATPLSESPLMRCAPHSALISSQGTPQTFSV